MHRARRPHSILLALLLVALTGTGLPAAAGCGGSGGEGADGGGSLRVMATATFLADIAQNVAGDRFTVESLAPPDSDLHAFEPTPRDVARVSESDLFILNGGGLEGPLEKTLRSAAPDTTFVDASAGLASRSGSSDTADPHFWLDPTKVETYVENIRDAFAKADPSGADVYAANAAAYIVKLKDLDAWIKRQVALVPKADRLLVMNHMSHGYFADRYGFRMVGAVIPSVTTGESPTAKQLSELTAAIRSTGAKAIFVELDENPQLAEQIAAETGTTVVDDLRDHSLSEPGQGAATYIEMMKYDTRRIVEALRQ